MPHRQVARVGHKSSPWMFTSRVDTVEKVEVRPSMNATSRNPTDLRIIQQPFEELPSKTSQMDRWVCNLPWKLSSLDFALARCCSLSEVLNANGTWVTFAKTCEKVYTNIRHPQEKSSGSPNQETFSPVALPAQGW